MRVEPFVRTALVLASLLSLAAPAAAQDGRALFEARCVSCHGGSDVRVPSVASLRERPAASIVEALSTGAMRQQGNDLSVAERQAIARYLAPAIRTADTPAVNAACAVAPPLDTRAGVNWGGWGPALDNRRFQANSGLSVADIPRLHLKWAFGFADASGARGLPTVAHGRVFVGSQRGLVYALDAKSGCTIWSFQAQAGVRSGITVGPALGAAPAVVYFGDGRANTYALNAATGVLLWSKKIEEHAIATITATPALFQNRIYFAVSSVEEGQGNNARYECCTFRGSVVALDASTGALAWKTYTIANEPRPIGKNKAGAVRMGPSGAGIWASPTIDPKRRLLYAATGNMYTEPQQTSSDAVLAFSLSTGQIAWASQVTPNDVFVVGCGPNSTAPNCGDDSGPDFDFGNAPMLVTKRDGTDLIVIGQKSGVGFALDPDNKGAIVWQYRAGDGSALGGMEFGSAADADRAYFPVADGPGPHAGELHAVTLATGARAWLAPPPQTLACGARGRGCAPAILAAITATPDAVFAGSQDGGLRAYSTRDGAVLWQFDTNRDFDTVNGVAAKGASMSGGGPVVAGGMVFVGSGYGSLGGRAGNVLLAFGVD